MIGLAMLLLLAPAVHAESTKRTPQRTSPEAGDRDAAVPTVPQLPGAALEGTKAGSKATQPRAITPPKTTGATERQKAVAPPRGSEPPDRSVPTASPPAPPPLKAQGEVCHFNDQCGSGFCVDGLCCNTQCRGACEACSIYHGGQQQGVCTPLVPGSLERGC
ncbi:MAG: hypothetical protein HKP30_06860 [Myxococcales bacterium]|nr:hypothetical protein [Myxococcales bacterium]